MSTTTATSETTTTTTSMREPTLATIGLGSVSEIFQAGRLPVDADDVWGRIEQSDLTCSEHQDQLRRRMKEMNELNPFNFMRQAMERTFQEPKRQTPSKDD